ncbi:ATP-binding protein [Vreelandella utahensis]|uniref:ATP-binding protein n=1 Tax=Vreelandella halophila TaxID=86177 RepID=UPI00117B5EFE|nr:ATP-binding protein [Halomonas utahensis]
MPNSAGAVEAGRPLLRLLPSSLLGRILLLTLLAMGVAQIMSSIIWVETFRARQEDRLVTTTRNLASSVAATTQFFNSLPREYQHIVLDQLRDMGGSRFFVSLNNSLIEMKPLPDSERKQLVMDEVTSVLRSRLGNSTNIHVEFVHPDDLRLLNTQLPLESLPESWAHYSLTLDPIKPPVLVTQVEVAEGKWLYLASLLPAPYVSLDEDSIPGQQIVFILVMIGVLFPVLAWLVRGQTRPLHRLARAARDLPLDEQRPPLQEQGSSEIVAVTRGFNTMHRRLQSYISDRDQLFRAISHDLKTPITRLRLRAGLIDDATIRERFENDLQELELLVKGALQSMKDTHIHENVEAVDIDGMIRRMAEAYNAESSLVTVEGSCGTYRGKPLALKRCLGNLLDNAIKYGEKATVFLEDSVDQLVIRVHDYGPGIPEAELDRIFEPYYRLGQEQRGGHGLGLGIARNIAQSHGGELLIANGDGGGLDVTLTLPRY